MAREDGGPIASRYDAFIFDLDGTILLGETLLPTARATVAALRARGCAVLFLTNNTTSRASDYAAKLSRLGLAAHEEEVVTAAHVLVELLKAAPGARLQVIGERPLVDELEEAGFSITTEARETDVVVASFDRTFSYRKLEQAFRALRAGARFIATNADRFRPTQEGGEPDAAAIIAAIEACSSVKCETIVGKPSEATAALLLHRLESPANRCLLVGDRLETDILLAFRAGFASALVLTGATSAAEANRSDIQPTYVLHRLADLL